MPKSPQEQLAPELAEALKIAILAKCQSASSKVTDQIAEGAKVAFDLRVDLKGMLTRGHGYESKPTSILLSKAVLARLLRNLGATRQSAKIALQSAAMEALEAGKLEGAMTEALLERDRELLLTIDEVDRDILAKLPKVQKSGAIKVAATVTFTRSKLEPQNL